MAFGNSVLSVISVSFFDELRCCTAIDSLDLFAVVEIVIWDKSGESVGVIWRCVRGIR